MTKKISIELLPKTELLLDGELSIQRVAELKERLQQAIEQSKAVDVDLTQVERIDLCVLQLFCSAHHTTTNSGRCLRLLGPLPDSVRSTVADAGLSDLIDYAEGNNEQRLQIEDRGEAL